MNSRGELRGSIKRFSQSLGPDAAAVASALSQLGVHGVPRDSTRCALARYLSVIVSTESSVNSVAVTDRSIHVKRGRGRLPVIVCLPRPVRIFIRAFDNGCYPELVATVDDGRDTRVPGHHRGSTHENE
jgi:hypothetical protein